MARTARGPMTPEEFMASQQPMAAEPPKMISPPKPRKIKQISQEVKPDINVLARQLAAANLMGRLQTQQTYESNEQLEPSAEAKFILLAKGQVYNMWLMSIFFSAAIMLIGVLYPYPLREIIIAMALGMDAVAIFMWRHYMR